MHNCSAIQVGFLGFLREAASTKQQNPTLVFCNSCDITSHLDSVPSLAKQGLKMTHLRVVAHLKKTGHQAAGNSSEGWSPAPWDPPESGGCWDPWEMKPAERVANWTGLTFFCPAKIAHKKPSECLGKERMGPLL